jgi:iron complex outermembrane receptor protein
MKTPSIVKTSCYCLAAFLVVGEGNPAYSQEEAVTLEEIMVTGSRRPAASPTDIPSPVDIIDADALTRQGATNISELLRTTVPSFNVSEQPISGTATSVRPANLRGLSPDHTLILVNGKRRHRTADIPTFGNALIIGSQGPDLASIPAIALKQVQVLRDGAAAQYGADAIAGVINFVLEDDPNAGAIQAKYGSYKEGDGDQFTVSGLWGTELGKEGFVVFSGEYSESDPTDRARSENLTAIQDLIDNGVPEAVNENVVWGSPEINDNFKLFYNMAVNAGENSELYSFGSWAERETIGGFFYRNSAGRDGIFTSNGNRLVGDLTPDDGNFCPGTVEGGGLVPADASSPADQALIAAVGADPNCFTWANVFPGGYSPLFGSELEDTSFFIGLRGETASAWKYDVSVGLGKNEITFTIENVASPSFPYQTSFDDLGSRTQEEQVLNIDLSKEFEVGFHSPLNVALGYEWREEEWSVRVGQLESFGRGPLFDQGFASGTDGYFGYGPASAGSFSRRNYALYIDLEADVAENFIMGAALRYEDFSDLGDEVTGKITGLWKVTESFGIRATYSTGFHAPTPAQQNFVYAVTEGDDAGNLVESGIVPADNPVAASFGAVPPVPEESESMTIGLVYESDSFSATLDVYRIEVDDRITLSSSFAITDEQREELSNSGFVGVDQFASIQFFTNDFDTETKGVDLVVTVPFELGSGSSQVSANFNWTETEVTDNTDSLTGPDKVFALEEGLPEIKGNITFSHTEDRWRALARANYFDDSTSILFGNWLYETGSATTVDVEFAYSFTDQLEVSVGGTNIFDELPKDLGTAEISNLSGGSFTLNDIIGTRYAPETPWGFNGAFWYTRVQYNF